MKEDLLGLMLCGLTGGAGLYQRVFALLEIYSIYSARNFSNSKDKNHSFVVELNNKYQIKETEADEVFE